jgi:uroporphyrin-III C-methyltransferase/precorrin-2 dehydrogenase/sirohydrochlorin ferrochelatase
VGLLLSAGADVTVIAPSLTDNLTDLMLDGRFVHVPRIYANDALEPYWLVVAATDDRAVNARVAAGAEAAKRFCNVVDDLPLCTFIMPAIVDHAPVTIAIGSSGNSPVLARWVKGLIETLLPSRLGALAELAGRWRKRVHDAVPDATERRHFWERVVTGAVADHAFAGRDTDAESTMAVELERWGSDDIARRGEAYLVGAGPGSPDLITIRGRRRRALRPARERRAP